MLVVVRIERLHPFENVEQTLLEANRGLCFYFPVNARLFRAPNNSAQNYCRREKRQNALP